MDGRHAQITGDNPPSTLTGTSDDVPDRPVGLGPGSIVNGRLG